jgi:hypothetical protein
VHHILEGSERCRLCEQYRSTADAPTFREAIWFIVGLIACFYAVYRWISL